jgi:prepilin-type N-terminal cleavage/methylation domain-containing protein
MTSNAGHPSREHGRTPGFTLIELLVVVAIIALLISILLPSLRNAREQAKQAVCMANMRSIGQAFYAYSQEFRGLWPPVVDQMAEQNRWPVPFFKAKIISQELNQYDDNGTLMSNGGSSVFLCPSELAPRGIPKWNSTSHTVDRVEIGGSYAYSGEIHRTPNGTLDLGASVPDPKPPYMNPVDNCRHPAEVFSLLENYKPITSVGDVGWRFYCDGLEGFYMGYRTIAGAAAPASAERFRIVGRRHLGKTNALAMDSHVEVQRPENITYNQVSWTRWDKYPDLPPGGK